MVPPSISLLVRWHITLPELLADSHLDLIFTYIFSLMTLYQLYRTYRSFIHTRQLFSLDHALSIPARTVLITSLPHHLRNERTLAQYWEDLNLRVESVSVGRNVGSLDRLLEERTRKLLALETAWIKYVGNPVNKKALAAGYDKDELVRSILSDEDGRKQGQHVGEQSRVVDEDERLIDASPPQSPTEPNGNASRDVEARPIHPAAKHFEVPGQTRPRVRPRIMTSEKVDMLDHMARQFRIADEAVRARRAGKFKPSNVAFVTFADLGSAQIAAQVAHYPQPDSMTTVLAPDPRDIHWHNMLLPAASIKVRQLLVLGATIALLLFWAVPVSALAKLLNYESIKETAPWLAKLVNSKYVPCSADLPMCHADARRKCPDPSAGSKFSPFYGSYWLQCVAAFRTRLAVDPARSVLLRSCDSTLLISNRQAFDPAARSSTRCW